MRHARSSDVGGAVGRSRAPEGDRKREIVDRLLKTTTLVSARRNQRKGTQQMASALGRALRPGSHGITLGRKSQSRCTCAVEAKTRFLAGVGDLADGRPCFRRAARGRSILQNVIQADAKFDSDVGGKRL